MTGRWLVWAGKRLVVPIGWYASMVFGLRPALGDPVTEFLTGAAILVGWAVVADWPGSAKPVGGDDGSGR